jgi:predicted nucleic acid-binding protein
MTRTVRDRLYLDTSVLGALADPGPRDRVDATRRLLDGLARDSSAGHISVVVLEEVERAPKAVREKVARELRKGYLMVLQESDETIRLAELYVSAGAVPEEYEDDARHIAVATVNDVRVIVSWNFRHMVNIERKRRINGVNIREGYPLIDLVSPWEITYEETKR